MHRVYLLLALMPCLFCTARARAASQNLLANPGFESPVLSPTNAWFAGVSGWTVGGLPTYGTTWAHPWNASTPCPEGNQHLWGSANQFYIEQAPAIIRSNTVYTFSVDLYRMDPQGAANSVQVGLVVPGTGYVDVKEYHPAYQPSKEDFVFLTDQWTRVTVQFNSATAPAHVGKTILATVNSYYCAIDNAAFTSGSVAQTIYYISSSAGSDSSDGLSQATAWRSFTNVNALVLQPGDTVLLKSGDAWNQELNLTGKGTPASPITLGAYGTGNKPRIQRADLDWDRCAVINNPSYWRISDLDCRTAKLGIYLRYWNDYNNYDVQIHSCFFTNLSSQNVWHPSSNNYEYAWSAAIFLGGMVNTFANPYDMVLDGLLISNCFANDAGQVFINNWYWPAVYKRRLRNLLFTENVASNCFGGLVAINCASEARITRSRAIRSGLYSFDGGTTAGFSQSVSNCLIDDCEFAYTVRPGTVPDGCGWDLEGDGEDLRLFHNVFHHNDGPAILNLLTISKNLRSVINSNTFYNNCRNPYNSDNNFEFKCGSSDNTGWIIGNGIYRGAATGAGTPGYFSSRWVNHVTNGNRHLLYSSVSSRPLTWLFDTPSDFEGWGSFADWSPVVSGGTLNGASSSANPHATSAQSWANSHQFRYIIVRMATSAGTEAQIYFITETDGQWDNSPPLNKRIAFPITSDGSQRIYKLDLRTLCPFYRGVATRIRLHPTNASGASIAVDYVTFSEN